MSRAAGDDELHQRITAVLGKRTSAATCVQLDDAARARHAFAILVAIRPDWVCEIVSPKHEKRDLRP